MAKITIEELSGSLKESLSNAENIILKDGTSVEDNILNIRKLEECETTQVETEDNFYSLENTSKGYIEGVKLEGKTLVNLTKTKTMTSVSGDATLSIGLLQNLKPNQDYTLFFRTTTSATYVGRACFVFELTNVTAEYVGPMVNWEPAITKGSYKFKFNERNL